MAPSAIERPRKASRRHVADLHTGFRFPSLSAICRGNLAMQITVRLFCIIGCFLLVTSCSRPRGEKATADLVGKWRTEKLDVERLINEMNEKGFGMPAQLRSSVEEKLKQAGSLTGDWEFNADGTAKFGRTG